MKPIYEVPIIPQNLRREETIVQIAEALNYLQEVSDDILNRVNRRISSNETYLSSIANRVNVVQMKVNKLSGAKKATQVFSSSKYPATDVNKRYVSIFKEDKPLPVKHFNVDFKHRQTVKDEPMESLSFYHVKVKDPKNTINLSGLGEVPVDVTSVNDLLLFNSSTNPYNKYVVADPLQGTKISKKEKVEEHSEIGAAPASFMDKSGLVKSSGQNFSYTPNLGQVPAIDVPIHLPDLPGIADDLRYINELGPGIAPSVTTTPLAPEVPPLDFDQSELGNNGKLSVSISSPVAASSPLTGSVNMFENEPSRVPSSAVSGSTDTISSDVKPTPARSTVSTEENITKRASSVQVLSNDATASVATVKNTDLSSTDNSSSIGTEKSVSLEDKHEKQEQSNEVDAPIPKSSKQPDAHETLMEAIRKAGGKANAKLKPPEPKTKKIQPAAGDLMTDLYAKLTMRRKGISGAKSAGGQIDAGSAMQRVSAMIPPPPTSASDTTDTTNPDDEWDD